MPDVRILAAVSAGGAAGALARHALTLLFGPSAWTIAAINVLGCLLIAVLMARPRRPALRAFLGPGVLGGFTTFSTAIVATRQGALVPLAATAAGGLLALYVGARLSARVSARVSDGRRTEPA